MTARRNRVVKREVSVDEAISSLELNLDSLGPALFDYADEIRTLITAYRAASARVVSLRRGDVIVVKLSADADVDFTAEWLAAAFAGHRVVILAADAEFDVIAPAGLRESAK